jgi:hypothetical protein
MGRKYNCKHPGRGISNYPNRLARRGLSKSPTMEPLDRLRARQKNIGPAANPVAYAGWDMGEEEAPIGTHAVQNVSRGNHPTGKRHVDR